MGSIKLKTHVPIQIPYFQPLMKICLPAIFLLLLLTTATITKAQEFGGNPPSVKWEQINMPAAKVIFPAGLDSAGRIVANIIAQMNNSIKPTIGTKQKQISILMQNQTTVANGYVGLAPFRSEFYLSPDQNSFELGSLYWPAQLAIHEFRHVQQYNNFNVGLSHAMRILFGEGGQALFNDIAVPNWFFEGDAVFNETHVSDQGRGRLPYFLNGMRVLWADGRNYSYMKIRNGSYLDYTPNWYPLGYMLVSWGRNQYGDDFWRKVTHDAAAYHPLFFPFDQAIKKYSGKDFDAFRTDAFNHFKSVFDEVRPEYTAPASKHFDADREYPAFVDDNTLIYMKSPYNHVPIFVIKKGGSERKIAVRSVSLDTYFAYHQGKIVYSAYRPDLRWNYRDYSELMLLDVKTGNERRLTIGTKYFSPDFSPSGKTIVTVEEATNGKCTLHFINAETGKLIRALPNPGNLFYTYPKFYDINHIISAIRTPQGKMTLDMIDLKTGENKYLLPLSYQPIVFPSLKNDTVYFSATYGADDRIFALSLKSGKLFLLDNSHVKGFVGSYEPAAGDKMFAWVGLTAFGYRFNVAEKNALKWAPIDPDMARGALPDFGISALKRDSSTDLLAKVKIDSLPITKYHKSYHLFNFHSIIPNFVDPNYTLSLEGENVLNTFQSELLFNYNRDEGYKELGFDATYGALFPYISGGADYYIDRRNYYRGTNIYWNETDLHAGLELPLNFSEGKNFTYLQAGSDVYYTGIDFQPDNYYRLNNYSYTYLNYYINFSNSIQQPKQNIYPRLGQSLMFDYKSSVTGAGSQQFLANGIFYFPGLSLNHNLVLNGAFQGHNLGDAIDFSNNFPFSRGYEAENLYRMYKAGADYAFPIAYPDAGFANLFFLQRIRGNAFFDYTYTNDFYTNGAPFKATFRSTGMEIYFDSQFFNQAAISFGFRYSYLLDPDIFGYTGRSRFEIIVPVTVF